MGEGPFSFSIRRSTPRCRQKKTVGPSQLPVLHAARIAASPPLPRAGENVDGGGGSVTKGKNKKKGGARLWMRVDRSGGSEMVEWDKNAIIQQAAIPARDLRILGPVFSDSSIILAREKAMVVNLEFIKAIITAEEVLLLDPLRQEILPFVEQLRQQLPFKNQPKLHAPADGQESEMQGAEHLQSELPFEFQVLEIALEVVYTYAVGWNS